MGKKDLAYFKNLKYDLKIKESGNQFILTIPELSLIIKDEALDKAYSKLKSEKESYFEEMIQLDLEEKNSITLKNCKSANSESS